MKLFKINKILSITKSKFIITPYCKNILTNDKNEKENHSESDIRNEDYTPKRTAEGRSYGTSADTFLKGVRHKNAEKKDKEEQKKEDEKKKKDDKAKKKGKIVEETE